MWYFAWILGNALACCLGNHRAGGLEHVESGKAGQKDI
ncbi:cytochrome bd-I oxidase subunit CydX [Escherichia coli]